MLMPWSIDVIGFCVMRLKNLAILSLLLIILIVVVGLPESLDTIMNAKCSERLVGCIVVLRPR